ncbi:MAG: CHC2 zinc finger domain-containing protein [Hyphomicrobium sp.]
MGYVDYAALKAAVDIQAVAAWLGLETRRTNEQLRCECPKHGGGKRSLVITPAKQLFYCFAPTGQTGGDAIELVAHCKDITVKEAALEIEKQFIAAKPDAPDGLQKVATYLDHGHEAVLALGLSQELAAALGIGFAPKGVMRGRVLIPLRTADGTLAGYAGYADALDPKFKFPGKLFV